MRLMLSLVLAFVMLTRLASAASGTASIKAEIIGMPVGTSIELRLKDQQKLRGARGAVSDSGFTLVDTRSGERQIAFDDVVSVKQLKSHTKRNILIAVGVGVAAVTVVLVIVGVRSRISGY